ncbi:MAG: LD-carboxypeptidase [Terrisporobacter sp.]|uniref:S66 peptidase family protein n=1 Tax=Terrisporobacter sp. TaxID=1965305 RepID=UPI002FC7E009
MRSPKPLKKNDTIGIIAPASPVKDIKIEDIKYELNKLGYQVKIGRSCYLSYKGYLSGIDEMRALDLERMFLDKDVDVVWCIRGGYGCGRILDLIDFTIIRDHPKLLIGFSDITALHICINQMCDLATNHGIMLSSIKKWDEFTYKSIMNSLTFEEELIIENPPGEMLISLNPGCCEGIITGGNLSLLTSSLGTKYEIDTKEKILFIEEIGEYTYKIDKMLNHLYLAKKFDDCIGIIFGDFKDCKPAYKNDEDILGILKEIAYKVDKPTLYNLKCGHCRPMVSLPLGEYSVLDCDKSIVKIQKNKDRNLS